MENIVDSIDNSRKCLLVVSRQFCESSWCMFEAHLASHRLVQENRQSLVVVRLNDIEERLLNKEMQFLLGSLTFLAWPRSPLLPTATSSLQHNICRCEADEAEFWHKLKVTLLRKSDYYSSGVTISSEEKH